MQTDAREYALELLEIARRSPNSKDRALHLAQMWLVFAVIEDALAIWADEVMRETTIH
jgi:hypothetical protein